MWRLTAMGFTARMSKEGGMKKILIAITLTFGLALASLVSAGEYVLIEGKNKEVCREYGKNLNSFKKLPHAMVCERKLNPRFTDFKTSKWETLDVWENREIVGKMDRYLWNSRTESQKEAFDKNFTQWLEKLKERIKNNEISLSLTRVDIDNNGKLDNVIQYDMGTCSDTDENSFTSPGGRIYLVFNEDITAINENLSNFTKVLRLGIFIYKGRTYLDFWGGWPNFKDGKVFVYDSVMNTTGWTDLGAKICIYKYKSK